MATMIAVAAKFRRTNPVAGAGRTSYSAAMALTRERMLERMLASDPSYDGRFLTGVLSTGIYCLPSCRARKPKPENVRFFQRPDQAVAAGLRPCKRCRPEDFYRDHDPDRERLQEVVGELVADPASVADVATMAARIGVGSSKLSELTRRHYHTTARDLITRARIDAARRALLSSRRAVTDIAFDTGFETLSAFHACFRKLNYLSPSRYRALGRSARFELELPRWFQRDRVLAYLGRDPDSPSERVDGTTLRFATRLDGRVAAVAVDFVNGRARCRVGGAGSRGNSATAAAVAHHQVIRLLGLVTDPGPFERRVRAGGHPELIAGRRGLTVPQTRDLCEGLTWVVLGQQVSLPVALALRRRLIERLGAPVGDLRAHPEPDDVAAVDHEELRAIGLSSRKAEYLTGLAERTLRGEFDGIGAATATATATEQRLLAVRGLGPWSCNYLMMRSLGLGDCVPVGDAALLRALVRFFDLAERPTPYATRELLAPFAPHRSLATFHLWASLQVQQQG